MGTSSLAPNVVRLYTSHVPMNVVSHCLGWCVFTRRVCEERCRSLVSAVRYGWMVTGLSCLCISEYHSFFLKRVFSEKRFQNISLLKNGFV